MLQLRLAFLLGDALRLCDAPFEPFDTAVAAVAAMRRPFTCVATPPSAENGPFTYMASAHRGNTFRYAVYVMPHVRLKMPAMVAGCAQSPEPHWDATRNAMPRAMAVCTCAAVSLGEEADAVRAADTTAPPPFAIDAVDDDGGGVGGALMLVAARISASRAHAVFTGLDGPSTYCSERSASSVMSGSATCVSSSARKAVATVV